MANPSVPFPSGRRRLRGPLPKDPRYEISFEESAFNLAPATRLLSKIGLLTGRAADALGGGYARAVGFVLDRVERFEDSSAERRLRQPRRVAADPTGAPAAITPISLPSVQK